MCRKHTFNWFWLCRNMFSGLQPWENPDGSIVMYDLCCDGRVSYWRRQLMLEE